MTYTSNIYKSYKVILLLVKSNRKIELVYKNDDLHKCFIYKVFRLFSCNI